MNKKKKGWHRLQNIQHRHNHALGLAGIKGPFTKPKSKQIHNLDLKKAKENHARGSRDLGKGGNFAPNPLE